MNLVCLTSVAVTVWETVSAFVPQLLLTRGAAAELVSASTGEPLPFAVSTAGKCTQKAVPLVLRHKGYRRAEHLRCYACVTEQALFIIFTLLKSFKQDLKNSLCPVSET